MSCKTLIPITNQHVSDCKIAKVGPGIGSKNIHIGKINQPWSLCGTSGFEKQRILECPASVNKTNWLGGDTWPDTFSVIHHGYRSMNGYQRNITVKRTDSSDGWATNLQFLCCDKEGMVLNFHIHFV